MVAVVHGFAVVVVVMVDIAGAVLIVGPRHLILKYGKNPVSNR